MRSVEQAGELGDQDARRDTEATFPADEVVWGIAVRPGFDELDDPSHHRGFTQHAFLEGNDNVALCGFRPPLSGPRHRRRARLALPNPVLNPMCGTCARRVVAPRSRVAVPVQPDRPAFALPVAGSPPGRPGMVPGRPAPMGVSVAPRAFAPAAAAAPVASRPAPGPGTPGGRPAPAGQHPFGATPSPSAQEPAGTPGEPAGTPGEPAPQPPTAPAAPVLPWVGRTSRGPEERGVAGGGLLGRGIRPDLDDF